MKVEQIQEFMIVDATDESVGVWYQGSSKKGKRPWLILKIDYSKKVFWVIPFNSKSMNRESKENFLELHEMSESLLDIKKEPKDISFSKLPNIEYNSSLNQSSIDRINQKKQELRIYWIF